MNHRQSSTITIYRKVYVTSGNTTTPTDVAQVTVPITAACRRVIRLMSEDSVTLSFALPSEDIYQPKIGDFVNDELFGQFYLAQEALCEYNKATGGYEYNLTFVRDYWLWNNHILMFVATRHNVDETHTGRIIHYDIETRTETSWMLTDTLAGHCYMIAKNLSALGFGNVTFDITADYADEVRYIAYDNIHICDALTAIANEYECEWWVTENGDARVIHFGKCEQGTPYHFCIEPILNSGVVEHEQNVESMTVSRDQSKYANRIAAYGSTKNLPISYHRTLSFVVTHAQSAASQEPDPIEGWIDDEGHQRLPHPYIAYAYMFRDANKEVSLSMANGQKAKMSYGTHTGANAIDVEMFQYSTNEVVNSWLRLPNGTQPSDLVVGTEFTLNIYDPTDTYDGGLIMGKIPDAWWLDDMDNPSSLQSLGERRLMLPDNAIWVTPTGNTPIGREIVEDVAIFDYIFPRCFLRVTSVTELPMKGDETVVDDGSSKSWDWIQYAIGVERIDGEPFPFLNTYQTKDTELEMVFVSEIDEQDAYDSEDLTPPQTEALRLLAGMTFKVGYDDSTSLFTLIRNEDYGAKLPNGILKPSINDVLVLTGWDVKAMDSLGLIDEAEQRLKKEAQKYVNALQEGQFTFGCNMMSQWPFSLASGGSYNLPKLGDKVTIHHAALRLFQSGSWVNYKTSRIIGIETKLDMPYDTPLVTVGETEAFSRLKMMERAMSGQGHGVRTKIAAEDDAIRYAITTNFDGHITSNAPAQVKEFKALNVQLTAATGYNIGTVVVTMGETDITSTAYNSSTGVISIASVTDAVTIMATATAKTYNVTASLDSHTSSNAPSTAAHDTSVSIQLTAAAGFHLSTVSVLMNLVDVTSQVYNSSTGVISIASVTGAIIITASSAANSYSVTTNLTNCTSDAPNVILGGATLVVELTAASGYAVDDSSVVVTMGGNTLTGVYADGVITIDYVIGDISITAVAESPYDAEVEYLQADGGAAYINTGIKGTNTIKVIIEAECLVKALTYIFGSQIGINNSTIAFVLYSGGSSRSIWEWGGAQNVKYNNPALGTCNIDNTANAKNLIATGSAFSGTQTYSGTSTTFSNNLDIYLFACNRNGSKVAQANAKLKIYSAKFYDGSTLLRDFIPVRKNGVGYMYDQVSGTLFGNAASSGAFSYGSDKTT